MLPEKRLIRSWLKGDRPRPVCCSGLPAVPRCPPGQFHGGLEPSGARHPLCLPEGGAFLPPDLRHSPGPRLGSPQTPLPRDGTPLPSGPQQPGQGGRLIPLQWAVGQDRPQPCRTFRLFRPLPGLQNRPCLSGSRLPLQLCFDPVFPTPGRLFGPGASLRLRRAARRLRPLPGSAGGGGGGPPLPPPGPARPPSRPAAPPDSLSSALVLLQPSKPLHVKGGVHPGSLDQRPAAGAPLLLRLRPACGAQLIQLLLVI